MARPGNRRRIHARLPIDSERAVSLCEVRPSWLSPSWPLRRALLRLRQRHRRFTVRRLPWTTHSFSSNAAESWRNGAASAGRSQSSSRRENSSHSSGWTAYLTLRPPLAQQKARTSARFRMTTAQFEERVQTGRAVLMSSDEVIAIGGGVPIVEEGRVIGALGVSGGTAAQDAAIGEAAIAADANGTAQASSSIDPCR